MFVGGRSKTALRAGVAVIAFRSGGWSDAQLAGAIAIYDGPWDLLARIEDSPLSLAHLPIAHSPPQSDAVYKVVTKHGRARGQR